MIAVFILKICLTILFMTFLWFIGLAIWITKNPEISDNVKNRKVKIPWFFIVWVVLYYVSIPALALIVLIAIFKILMVMWGI